jgi:hypothetical protein
MGLIYSKYDEFQLWLTRFPGMLLRRQIEKGFRYHEDVVIESYTGPLKKDRTEAVSTLHDPSRVHLSTEAIGNAIEWFQ